MNKLNKFDLDDKRLDLLTEIFDGVQMLSPKTQPDIDMNQLRLLGIGTKNDLKLTSNRKQLSESEKKKKAMKIIQQNISESIELAKEFGFENLYNKLNSINSKVNSKLLNS